MVIIVRFYYLSEFKMLSSLFILFTFLVLWGVLSEDGGLTEFGTLSSFESDIQGNIDDSALSQVRCHEFWLTPILKDISSEELIIDLVSFRFYGKDPTRVNDPAVGPLGHELPLALGQFSQDPIHRLENLFNENSTSYARIGRYDLDREHGGSGEPWFRMYVDGYKPFNVFQLLISDNAHTLRNLLNYRLSIISFPPSIKEDGNYGCLARELWSKQYRSIDDDFVMEIDDYTDNILSHGRMAISIMNEIELFKQPNLQFINRFKREGVRVIWSKSFAELKDNYPFPPLMLQFTRDPSIEEDSLISGNKLPINPYKVTSSCHYLKYSHNGQDTRVISYFGGKRNGTFIELGATEGIAHSNTYTLEKFFDWKGLVVEAVGKHCNALKHNRPRSWVLCPFCVYDRSFLSDFITGVNENEELSGVEESWPWAGREGYRTADDYVVEKVPCFAINEVLNAYGLVHVDYLSVDLEGADLLVLKSIDWSKFAASIVSVECHGDNEVMFKQLLAFFIDKLGYATWERFGWDLMFFK